MNPIRQLWRLIRADNETPVIAQSRVVEEESADRQRVSIRLIQGVPASLHHGPLEKYIWGAGKKND
jgi:hypothetical protein